MSLGILYCGVDTLEVSFVGELLADMPDVLDAAKARAQATDTPVPLKLGEDTLYVQAKGLGKYAWVLSDHRMQVRVSRTSKGMPTVSIRLWASSLATFGHVALYREACGVVAHLGDIKPNALSRIDLATDVQGFEFTDAHAARIVCPASYRATHKDGEGFTYQFGKGDVVVRVYRKDAELRAKKKLSYAKLWERVEHYEPESPVLRVEVQLRGAVLNELNARSVESAFAKLSSLYAFGLSWCELRVPTSDATKTRWPVDIKWTVLAATWGVCQPEPRVRLASRVESVERVLSRLCGALASLAAYSGQTDLETTMEYALAALEIHLKERKEDFRGLVGVKSARIGSDEEVAF